MQPKPKTYVPLESTILHYSYPNILSFLGERAGYLQYEYKIYFDFTATFSYNMDRIISPNITRYSQLLNCMPIPKLVYNKVFSSIANNVSGSFLDVEHYLSRMDYTMNAMKVQPDFSSKLDSRIDKLIKTIEFLRLMTTLKVDND